MSERLIRWCTYNLFFALLPLGASLSIHALLGSLTLENISKTPEILFFMLMANATVLGDVTEKAALLESRSSTTYHAFRSTFLLGSVVSAMFYGILIYDSILDVRPENFHINLFRASIVIAIASFFLSTAVEVMIGRLEDEEKWKHSTKS